MVEKALTTTEPVRTCIGCRQRAAAADLVRLAAATEQGVTVAVIDHTSTKPGRGAWLHHDPDCLRTAMRRRALGPALRVPGLVVDTELLEREMGFGDRHPDANDGPPRRGGSRSRSHT